MRTEERRNIGTISPGNEGNDGLKGIIRIDVGKCREYLGSVGIQVNRSIGH
jgi:hypothetical protein